MTTIKAALDEAMKRLAEHESAALDAEVLLAHVLGRGRAHLHAWPDKALEPAHLEHFEALVRRRAAGEPVAHLTGEREFWSLPLAVTSDTLIPRPETELLVELALQRIATGTGVEIADLGTGSGAIALALASERPGCRVTAVDRSAGALTVAKRNATQLELTNVVFIQGDWCDALDERRFQLITSNPPYIPTADPHLQQGDVRFEPADALVGGADGLDAIRRITACAQAHLQPDGWLLLEHGYDQGAAVRGLLQAAGYTDVQTYQDAAGHDRVTLGRWATQTAVDNTEDTEAQRRGGKY